MSKSFVDRNELYFKRSKRKNRECANISTFNISKSQNAYLPWPLGDGGVSRAALED